MPPPTKEVFIASDCPICLEEMSPTDVSHPLLCSKKCGYNFCLNCVDHLIKSSKSAVEEASDGNLAVKINLHCPQCRSDLSETIHDTLLLRKYDSMNGLLTSSDSELTASELRKKASFDCPQMSEKVELARSREEHFLLFNSLDNFGKEEGVEVDHDGQNCFIGEAQSQTAATTSSIQPAQPPVDSSLFGGLEFSMTEAEQRFVNELMTSGEVSKLAQAAQILSNIAEMSLKGTTPSMRQGGVVNPQLVHARPRHLQQRTLQSGRSSSVAVGRALAMGRTEEDKKQRKRQTLMEQFKKTHPLPVRMPNHVALDADGDPWGKRYQVSFVDDEWDGTVADAFSRVMIGRNNKITKKQLENHPGVQHVLSADTTSNQEYTGPRNRVVVSAIKTQAGRLGIQKGDVVTHFNGEIFRGNAEDLRVFIKRISMAGKEEKFSLTLNAEHSTAEALRRRAILLNALVD